MLNYYEKDKPIDIILPFFDNVNDVLKLTIEMSDLDQNQGKKVKFKSFSNWERRLLMDLLNQGKNRYRYEDIIKHKKVWVWLCIQIHPNKFKNKYPDSEDDLLGSYKFLWKKENKSLRVEYNFYKKLYEMYDRLMVFKKWN